MKIFVIYVGGKTKTSLIKVHDIYFIIAEKIEDTYEELKSRWWGILENLGNYHVLLKKQPNKL